MQKASCTGKPSARAGPVSPGVFESLAEGLCRLLPEPVRRIGLGHPLGRDPSRTTSHYQHRHALRFLGHFLLDPTGTRFGYLLK